MAVEIASDLLYCPSTTRYQRRKSRVVRIGNLAIGGSNPIRVQSMTTVDTMDTEGSVEQSIRMIEAGCEIVRLTAPSLKEAANLEEIRNGLRDRGYETPLVADIHFTPNAAELSARIVEKVRINPGNYADKKKFQQIEYDEISYEAELDRIRKKFTPLVSICKERGTAMRIGTNHGSLSDRIMSRYGDTPLGMVESALEFVRICEDNGFYDIVLSMKASNPLVMVQAYRLLVNRLDEEGLQPYPLHLGVTEAGEGEDGRIKSAVGIGALLEDGLGDTIRVSLTEEPEYEIPVAQKLVDRYTGRSGHDPIPEADPIPIDPFSYSLRHSRQIYNVGGDNVPRVIADFSSDHQYDLIKEDLKRIGHHYLPELDKWGMSDNGADFIYTGKRPAGFMLPNGLREVMDVEIWDQLGRSTIQVPMFASVDQLLRHDSPHPELNFLATEAHEVYHLAVSLAELEALPVALLLRSTNEHRMADLRRAFFALIEHESEIPVVIQADYQIDDSESFQLYSSTDVGGLMLDGFGDGVMLGFSSANNDKASALSRKMCNETAFGILQAARRRITKTEYISCPSCGRTLFDLQETTAMIRQRTDHLKGIKIGIMGCIVNGPGEMADADYGYVGSGIGKITLYKGKDVVKRGVASSQAVDQLIDLIREDGNWIEPN